MVNEAMFNMLIKAMGMEPDVFKENFNHALKVIGGVDQRLARIESALGIGAPVQQPLTPLEHHDDL